MSLKSSFKVNNEKVNQGVWIELTDYPNTDGTVPSFKLARQSMQNKKYRISIKTHTKDRALKENDLYDDEASGILLKVFIESVLLGWKNFQPNDDGVSMDYSSANAYTVFSDPDWFEFYNYLSGQSLSRDLFSPDELEEAVKN